jgi:hypothetical protein
LKTLKPLALESILPPSDLANIRIMDFHYHPHGIFEVKVGDQESHSLYILIKLCKTVSTLYIALYIIITFRKIYLLTSPVSQKQLFLIVMSSFSIYLCSSYNDMCISLLLNMKV